MLSILSFLFLHIHIYFLLAFLLSSISHFSFCFSCQPFFFICFLPFLHFIPHSLLLSFPASPYSFLTSLSLSSLLPFVHPSFLAFFHLLHLRSPPSLVLNLHLPSTTCLCCFRSEVRGSHRMSELKQHTVC